MTNEPPEHAPLQDARVQLMRAATAIRAAVSLRPSLTQRGGDLHAQVIDVAEQLRELER